MGSMTVREVIQMLDEGGIRAEEAFPAQLISRVTAPVAAVSLWEVDQEKDTVTIQVEILGPKESGGYACQSKAQEACRILAVAGAVCRQGSCSFQSKSNLFRVQILAVFVPQEQVTITAGQWLLSYACGFSSEQTKEDEADSLEGMPWEITVEEFFPWGVQDTLEQEEPFVLEVHCLGNVEHYAGCRWIYRKRKAEKAGLRQVRKATAISRSLTSE